MLSSLRGEFKSEDYIQPHYKESYRVAIDHLVTGGRDGYQEFLKEERIGSFLSEDELLFITTNAQQPAPQNATEEINDPPDNQSSSGTYWPTHSDVQTPDLDLGWPEVMHEMLQTNVDLLFHPPRLNSPTIKEVIRKHIQDSRQVIAIVMDTFTDVDIFKEIVDASIRGVAVYVLLDHFHWKTFLSMAENQDVKLQQLRNMRVRTVKGQDYLCRSGARFHGAMKQKFLLVDCHTTFYGSYSFTWSSEKIDLSMVQVITGHLVKSYDEEFRTLYARSTVPAEVCPPEGLFQRNGSYRQQILPQCHSGPKIERSNQLRHTLDAVYRRTWEKKPDTRDVDERLYGKENNTLMPLFEDSVGVKNHMSQMPSAEAMNFWKRHSYAGEKQDGLNPQNMWPAGSNYNISRDTGNVTNSYLQPPQLHRGQNMRQSYNGVDKQQNIPTLENTSKSFMRTWRIDSYLKNPDVPFGDSCDYLDQFEPMDKSSAFMQGRMRSSLVFRPTMQEHMEPNRHMNNPSVGVGPNTPMHYSLMQRHPAADNRLHNDDLMLKKQGMRISDDFVSNAGYGPSRNTYHSTYASLGRRKGAQVITNLGISDDNWYKRHSVADPRSNTDYIDESSLGYGRFARMEANRSTAELNAQNGGYVSKLKDDQRSISQYDFKSVTDTKSPSITIWQEPPSRTVSVADLELNGKDLTDHSSSMGSQHFLKKSSAKIKSLLNMPQKKEDFISTMKTPSLRSCESTDTITAEDEDKSPYGGQKPLQTATNPVTSLSERLRNGPEDDVKSLTEEHQPQSFLPKVKTPKKPSVFVKRATSSKDRGADSCLHSRFDAFCSLEKRNSVRSSNSSGSTHSQEKSRSLPKGEEVSEHSFSRTSRGHHENKLERFIQRMGNLINKHK